MKTLSALAVIPVAILLLTWLSLQSINTNAEVFDRALGEMDRFTMLEASLHRDVLSARIGLLRNYDPLGREMNALEASLIRLRAVAPISPAAAVLTGRLAASLARQEDLVEHFKSDNALLQNSLAYFAHFTDRLSCCDAAGASGPSVSALAAAMLRLTLDTSPMAVRDVQDRLDDLAAHPPAGDDAEPIRAPLAHGRLLVALLPATDRILRALAVEPAPQDVRALRADVVARQLASRRTARRYRLILYLSSLILMGKLARAGLLLRGRTRALRRRAALEHVIAQISMDLLAARPDEIDARISRALGDLAGCIQADRAYFLSSFVDSRIETWSRRGTGFPPGWPDRAPALAAGMRPNAEGLIYVPDADRLAPGATQENFAEIGLRGWAYISGTGDDGSSAALGFDIVGWHRHVFWSDELGLIRMALDTILNAIGRERLERERAQLEARVQQAQRMETVGALASGIAHNFNNILGAIMGYAEIAEAGTVSESPLARNLGEIRRAGERARDLVDQILTFGRRRDTRRRPVCVRDLLSEAMSLLRASLPASVELGLRDCPDNIVVSGEDAQLQQIILNLCRNAAEAMDGAGRIDIDVIVQRLTAARSLSHGELAPGRYACLAVSDSGRGMTSQTLGRIFEPFFTTRDTGNGLGLATVREIAREHGGAMHVQSSPNQGSRFEAWLPCTIADSPAAGAVLPALAGGTILLIDDDREDLLRAEELVAALGYEPVGFTCPDDALLACRDAPSRFDLILIGQSPSVVPALEIAARLREILPDTPILFAVASAVGHATEALQAAGICDVVHWPLSAAEIAVALERGATGGGLRRDARRHARRVERAVDTRAERPARIGP